MKSRFLILLLVVFSSKAYSASDDIRYGIYYRCMLVSLNLLFSRLAGIAGQVSSVLREEFSGVLDGEIQQVTMHTF